MTQTVTISKETGTASSSTGSTLTDSSKSWGTNQFKERLVWIPSLDEVGYVKSNTATTLVLSSLSKEFSGDLAGLDYKIGLTFADLVSNYPGVVSLVDSDARSYKSNDTIMVGNGGFIGEIEGTLIFTSDGKSIGASHANGLIQLGAENKSEAGLGACSVVHRNNHNWNDFTPVGGLRLYNTIMSCPEKPNGNFIRYRFDNPGLATAAKRMICMNVTWSNLYVVFHTDDILINVQFSDGNTINRGLLDSRSRNISFNNCALIPGGEGTSTGQDTYDATWSGVDTTDTVNFNRPLAPANYNNPNSLSYFWDMRVIEDGFVEDTGLIHWLAGGWSSFPNDADIHFGHTIAAKVVDSSSLAVGLARLVLVDQNGDGAILTAKAFDGTNNYAPTRSKSISVDVSGNAVSPINTDKGLMVLKRTASNALSGTSTNSYSTNWTDYYTDLNPLTLWVKKYGYVGQRFAKSYSAKSSETFSMSTNTVVVSDEATALAHAGLAIDWVSKTLTYSGTLSDVQMYEYVQAEWASGNGDGHEEPLLSSDGVNFTLNTGWKLKLTTGIVGGIKITGNVELTNIFDLTDHNIAGIVEFTVAGTYNIENCTIGEVINTSGGNVTINALGITSIATNTGPNISIVSSKTLSFTVIGSSGTPLTGYEWRIYESDASIGIIGLVELAGEEVAVDSSQAYAYNYTADKPVIIQIIDQPNHEEFIWEGKLLNNDQTTTINLNKQGDI